ncbi:MAG: CrcB family protein [Frankiales bacterium]|nr:CrcB family protein [Frankiales bacterium]
MTWWAVALGAAVGAPCRYLLDTAVARPPYGILLVNLIGSLLAGVVAGLALHAGVLPSLLSLGFLGTFTTASTLLVDALELADRGERRDGARHLALSLVPGVALAAVGLVVGRALAG